MTFSVVIPVFNGAATIARAIDSVLAQSMKPLEVIVVDDGSTDETASILAHNYSGDVKTIRLPENSGSSTARNAGMDIATGAYIAFLDADDTWHPDKLLRVNRILVDRPAIALLFHLSTLAPFDDGLAAEGERIERIRFFRLLKGNFIQTPCTVVRNDTSFRFEPTMRYMEDYDLWLRIAHKHGIYFSPQKLTRLSRPVSSPGGISARKWDMRKGEMKAYLRLARLSPLFVILLPLLLPLSLLKHALKMAGSNNGRQAQ